MPRIMIRYKRQLRHMTFDVLSSATTLGHQKAHLSLLNSNISKLIHDQGKADLFA